VKPPAPFEGAGGFASVDAHCARDDHDPNPRGDMPWRALRT